jgi:hypothetical protein
MAVGTYTLPICDGCKLPWLPVGWTQDSDPRSLPSETKPLRCGKCKSPNWDREFVKQAKEAATETAVNPFDLTKTVEILRNTALNEVMEKNELVFSPLNPEACGDIAAAQEANRLASYVKLVPENRAYRCKHRMTDCPICHPKEAAQDA